MECTLVKKLCAVLVFGAHKSADYKRHVLIYKNMNEWVLMKLRAEGWYA